MMESSYGEVARLMDRRVARKSERKNRMTD